MVISSKQITPQGGPRLFLHSLTNNLPMTMLLSTLILVIILLFYGLIQVSYLAATVFVTLLVPGGVRLSKEVVNAIHRPSKPLSPIEANKNQDIRETTDRTPSGRSTLNDDSAPKSQPPDPVQGGIAARESISEEYFESYLPIPEQLIGPNDFAFRIRGDSMLDAGIHDGDLVIIHPQPDVEDGEIIAALIDDETIVRRLEMREGSIRLAPDNPAYGPINASEARIIGKVIAVIHHL